MSKRQMLKISMVSLTALLLLGVLAILTVRGTPLFASEPAVEPQSVDGVDWWTWRGPTHNSASFNAPQLNHIVIDPGNPSIVYANTNQGVYRSANGGETWEPRNGGLGGYGDLVVNWMALDPTNSQKLLIGTWGYGLFKSTDSGANWSRLTDPLATSAARAESATGPEPPPVRAGGPSGSYDLAGLSAAPQKVRPEGVLPLAPRLAGEERPASAEGLPNALPWTPVRQVAIDPNNTNHLYACIEKASPTGGLFQSWNGGDSWSPVGIGTNNCRTITIAPSNPSIRYASFGTWSTDEGLYRSINGGSSWSPVGAGTINGAVIALAIHPTNQNTVLAATSGDGIYRTLNGGDTWTKVSTELGESTFFSVAFAPGSPTVAYAGGYAWVYRSGDTGDSWANADTSFPTFYVQGLAIHPYSSSTVLVGANVFPLGGVYKRTSDGDPFAFKPTGMTDTFVLDLEQDPNNANVLYAATWGGGVFRSDNGGVTWNSRYGLPYIYSLEATQGPTGTVLYGTTFYTDYGIIRSDDQGDHWREISRGWFSDISFDIKSLDGGPQTLVVATFHGAERSNDGGATWNLAAGLNDGVVLRVARSPNNANRWLAGTWGGGIWASNDGGVSWSESSTGLGSSYVYDVAYAPSYPDTVYAASLGVYRSSNGGTSWSFSGIPDAWIRALDTQGGPYHDVFAGTHDRGVYMAPERTNWWFDINDGLTEQRIRSVEAVATDKLFAGTNGRGAWEYTIVNRPEPRICLPVVLRNVGPPRPPTLYPIDNPDGDGNYIVSWSTSPSATSYTLEEDDNASFSSPVTVYSGSGTSRSFSGKSTGTYYYRVNAVNQYGAGGWSITRSVTVFPPLPDRLYSVADATVIEALPGTNAGGTSDMWVGYDHCEPFARVRSLVRFDTSVIPPGTSISQARLSLYLVNSCDIGERTHRVAANVVTGSWTELGVTWNSKPGYGAEYGSVWIPSRTWGRYQIDVTNLVRGWVNGTITNRGLILLSNESSGNDSARLGFGTREASGTTYDPYLTITYTARAGEKEITIPVGGSPQPTTFGPTIEDTLSGLLTTPDTPSAGYTVQSLHQPE